MSSPSTSKDAQRNTLQRTHMQAMMVTRNKSAQMKHNLRHKEQTMKTIARYTQLLKSPTSQKNKDTNTKTQNKATLKNSKAKVRQKSPEKCISPKKVKRSVSILKPEKKQQPANKDSKEYYPQKLKRKMERKKEFLKPKHEMQMIGKTNKRKRGIPRKDTKSFAPQTLSPEEFSECSIQNSAGSPLLSIEELIRLSESTQDLTDEDLMEILTCPSPVWWEDAPHESYIEEAIGEVDINTKSLRKELFSKRELNNAKTSKISQSKTNDKSKTGNSLESVSKKDILNISKLHIKSDSSVLRKKSKLESILGNIKCKLLAKGIPQNSDKTCCELLKLAAKTDPLILSTDKSKISNLTNGDAPSTSKKCKNSETAEDFVMSIGVDEMLKDLENMEIPVEESIVIDDDDDKTEDDILRSSENSQLLDSKKEDIFPKQTNELSKEDINKNVNNKQSNKGDNEHASNDAGTEIINNDTETIDVNAGVPTDLPPLQQFPISRSENEVLSSPVSSNISEVIDSSSYVSNIEGDTISDTNICFILDDEDDNDKTLGSKKDISAKNAEFNKVRDCDSANIGNGDQRFFLNETKHLNTVQSDKTNFDFIRCDQKPKDKEFITIYKIISENGENIGTKTDDLNSLNIFKSAKTENSQQAVNNGVAKSKGTENINANGKLNDFYKKCKNVYRKKRNYDIDIKPGCIEENPGLPAETNENAIFVKPQTKNESIDNEKENTKIFCDACNPNKEPIILSESNDKVKYCHICSCIFDTEECTYCLRKAKNRLQFETFLCFCGVRSCCVTSFKNHSNSHER